MLLLDIEPARLIFRYIAKILRKLPLTYFLGICSSFEIIYIYNVGFVNFTVQKKKVLKKLTTGPFLERPGSYKYLRGPFLESPGNVSAP